MVPFSERKLLRVGRRLLALILAGFFVHLRAEHLQVDCALHLVSERQFEFAGRVHVLHLHFEQDRRVLKTFHLVITSWEQH